jgi:hypothetical protein
MAPPLVIAQESQRPSHHDRQDDPKDAASNGQPGEQRGSGFDVHKCALMNLFALQTWFWPSGTIANLDRFECGPSHIADDSALPPRFPQVSPAAHPAKNRSKFRLCPRQPPRKKPPAPYPERLLSRDQAASRSLHGDRQRVDGKLIGKQVLQRIAGQPAESRLRISISPPPHHAS